MEEMDLDEASRKMTEEECGSEGFRQGMKLAGENNLRINLEELRDRAMIQRIRDNLPLKHQEHYIRRFVAGYNAACEQGGLGGLLQIQRTLENREKTPARLSIKELIARAGEIMMSMLAQNNK